MPIIIGYTGYGLIANKYNMTNSILEYYEIIS